MIALKSQPTPQHEPRFRRRNLGTPSPPPHPLDSPEMRLLMAFLEDTLEGIVGRYDTVLAAERDRMAGRVGLAQYLPETVDPELRATFATGAILPGIIGVWQPDGDFKPGLADLTEQECRATELHLAGFNSRQIAEFLDRKRARAFGPGSLSVETVDRYVRISRDKLRLLFGVRT